jgi:hypothetical protein
VYKEIYVFKVIICFWLVKSFKPLQLLSVIFIGNFFFTKFRPEKYYGFNLGKWLLLDKKMAQFAKLW